MSQIKPLKVEVKMEPIQDDENSQSSTISSIDLATQRMSFVVQDDTLKNIIKRGSHLNVQSMRQFLARVKNEAENLTLEQELELLTLAVTCIDLTTLSGDDTPTNVERLCYRAIHSLDEDNLPNLANINCAAVCVYPARVLDCVNTFARIKSDKQVNIAAVATGFPSGQFGLSTRIAEIVDAVSNGANEIDVVINRSAAIAGNWHLVFEELCEMRQACDSQAKSNDTDLKVHLKVIIGAGDLLTSSPNTIYTASVVAILAGADFVKTSTGKEGVNATLPIGYIMMRAIIEYYEDTKIKIGFKPAGGIRTYKDALNWLILAKTLLGPEWLTPELFRFGASGLLDDVEKRILYLTKKKGEFGRVASQQI